jgi:hypothetical protein
MASALGLLVAMALYAVFTPLDMLAITIGRGEILFVIVCATTVLVGLLSLRQIIRRKGASYVRLSVDGVEAGNSTTSVTYAWDDIVEITDRPRSGRQAGGATYLVTDDEHAREVPSSWYTPGGHALHEFLCHYWQHPELRDELTDERAALRLEAAL